MHTRTHTYIGFASPHLVCDQCGQPVPKWHSDDSCGCDTPAYNLPCGHRAGSTSVCPSWSPVDGCTCPERHVIPADR